MHPDRSYVNPRRRPLVAIAVAVALGLLAAVAVADIQPPAPRSASAPVDVFSAGRAFRHVEEVGRDRHVAGSPAADRVRGYIVDTLDGFGLAAEVPDATGLGGGKWDRGTAGRVRNVVAVVRGTASTGRVVLMAHYDAAPASYGANDDGVGVAALLETARIVAAGPPPRNDIVFLFTDAEEAGLIGAEAFVNRHPLGRDPAVVLNLEARGSGGPVVMFETSRGNAALVGRFADVPHPVGSSVAVEIYRLLPNDTDLTPFLAHDRFTGLNSAYIDGSDTYHAPTDRPAAMDRGSLQQHGDNAVALVRSLGGADLGPLLRPAGADATYFPVPGLLLRYPGWLVWPLAVLAGLAVVALAALARRRGLTSWPRTAAATGLALVPVAGAALAAHALWIVLVSLRPGYGLLIEPGRPGWFRLAVVTLTAAVLLGWYALARRRVGPVPLAIGALGTLAVLGLVFAAAVPGGSYLAALPALAGAGAGAGALFVRPAAGRVAALAAGSAVGILVLVPTLVLFLPALGLASAGASAVFTALLGLALVPVLDLAWRPVGPPPNRLTAAAPAVSALAVALVCTGVGLVVDRWDTAHPLPTDLMYALDHDTGTAQWVSRETSPGTWTARYVRDRKDLSGPFPVLPHGRLAAGPATATVIAPPRLSVLADTTADTPDGVERTLRLRVAPQRPVRLLGIYGDTRNRRVVRATVNDRAAAPFLPADDRFGLQFHAPPPDGFELTLTLRGPEPFRLRLVDGSDGLDGLPGFRPRPDGVGIAGGHTSDLVVGAITTTV